MDYCKLESPSVSFDSTSNLGVFGTALFTLKEILHEDYSLYSISLNYTDLEMDFTDFYKSPFCRKIRTLPLSMAGLSFELKTICDKDIGFGLTEFELLNVSKENIKFWMFFDGEGHYWHGSFIAVKNKDFPVFLEFVEKTKRNKQQQEIDVPILPSNIIKDVYENSIAFLKRGSSLREQYEKHKIGIKRGILLSGKPGSGKTLTCKWIRYLAAKNNIATKVVTIDTYQTCAQKKQLKSLFEFSGKYNQKKSGIIFFDDMDMLFRDRESGNMEVYNFLTHLDGIEPTEGVVYFFTTNIIKDLDPAFVRPGRIDLFHVFLNPNESLRREFIEKKVHPEVLIKINVDKFVEETSEYSFAEIEEVRKLICMDHIVGKEVSLEKTIDIFKEHRSEFNNRLGFKSQLSYEESEPTVEESFQDIFRELDELND